MLNTTILNKSNGDDKVFEVMGFSNVFFGSKRKSSIKSGLHIATGNSKFNLKVPW